MSHGSRSGCEGRASILSDVRSIHSALRTGRLLPWKANRIASRAEGALCREWQANPRAQAISRAVPHVYVRVSAGIATDHSVGGGSRQWPGGDVARPALLLGAPLPFLSRLSSIQPVRYQWPSIE